MSRLYTLLCAACFFVLMTNASAQSRLFSHAIGGGLYSGHNYFGGALVYSPRLNYYHFSDKSTLSLGTQIGLGTSIKDNYNSNTGGNSTSIFMINVPVLLAWNYGNAANNNAYTNWGFFAAAGYGFQNASRGVEYIDDEEVTTNQVHVSGMAISTGLRFPVANSSFGLRFSYLFNNNHFNPDIHGIASFGIDYNIGVRIRRTR
ncbi:hypothetical protein [Chitinophaga arvensicola]|uniref:Outer membrane protein beta-barrel domain-containing protein n=1 Tax=Chitinophaga arvensicola TaxID=29529 RepID=A0A1I0QVB6_9BACT|nr:hypothetical protein [Chitinophaga arvensicola]SEW31220.1 hypothetical protein SAMN04488122_1763 [Chitinophaga arvensicola]